MASLTIGKRTSFVRLVELNKEYRSKLAQATDIFEKAEIAGMIEDISYFCIDRGGWNYLNAVKQNDPSLIQR